MSSSKWGNKATRATNRKRIRNRLVRRSLKTYVVKARNASDAGEDAAYQKTMMAISSVDKAVSKGVIHRNKGARLKAALMSSLEQERGAAS